MSDQNPYAPPTSSLSEQPVESSNERARLNRIASGQRLIVISILVTLGAAALAAAVGVLGQALQVVGLLVSLWGTYRLASALSGATWITVLCLILMVIPLVNLITMLVLSSRATRTLKKAGYKVGLLGASQQVA
ncbi:hypothetical protein [Niveibacterium sp. COAC-50]|uniref:hypothetical protein n=1 Tax=Niveibacterium sp. COAC-50 TaxID=2729384 RepID=UPI001557D620|nr:hypothetical protein [Niveibacterium sp. COAC-50]